jgi:hypothetical protein
MQAAIFGIQRSTREIQLCKDHCVSAKLWSESDEWKY